MIELAIGAGYCNYEWLKHQSINVLHTDCFKPKLSLGGVENNKLYALTTTFSSCW